MYITIRRLGEHRGAPRLYLDSVALTRAGFAPGLAYRIDCEHSAPRVTITLCTMGTRRVSRKQRGGIQVPVVDLNSQEHLSSLVSWGGVVRVVLEHGVIHVLALASHRKAAERAERLAHKVAQGTPLTCGSIAFGIGITSWALHAGLEAGGISAELALVNEIGDEFIDVAMTNNAMVKGETVAVHAPLQEAVMDDWMLRRLPRIDLLELAFPCSGASRAGASKRKLDKPEDHPHVGHLVGGFIQWIYALQPALVVAECTPGYQKSASASILRGWLRDAGYAVEEVILDASDFGSLEGRVRWFMVAHPPYVRVSLQDLAPTARESGCLAQVLDPIAPDDDRYRTVEHLKRKERRDRAKGSGFGMQLLTADATRVPTLRKSYYKAGSTDPRLLHPTDPSRSRLLTGAEHARIKGVDPALLAGLSDTKMHMVCGQAVDARPVHAVGRRIAQALRASETTAGHAEFASTMASRLEDATG